MDVSMGTPGLPSHPAGVQDHSRGRAGLGQLTRSEGEATVLFGGTETAPEHVPLCAMEPPRAGWLFVPKEAAAERGAHALGAGHVSEVPAGAATWQT